jgi:superfamily II DNA or RNA helicase
MTSQADSGLASRLGGMRFRWTFRRYQTMALDAYESRAPDHQHRCYLVMPPGSGKTAVGLEIIRREGNPAVVFCPNTAVQQQWLQQWTDFRPESLPASGDPAADVPLSILTYQSLCNLNPEHEELDDVVLDLWQETIEQERGFAPVDAREEIERLRATDSQQFRRDLSRFRGRARRMIARGDEPERLLGLLHPNGQELVQRIADLDACTLVLDECHHLLEMWGYLIRALVDVLGDGVLVVGLTATPPRELDTRQSDLYRHLFGYADFEVLTPAVVKEGELAAYQELGYLTRPLPQEADYIAEQHLRFEELIAELIGHEFATRPFLDWVNARVSERASQQGARTGWNRFERDNPALAQASLRLYHRFGIQPPTGVRLREPHRQQMSADDWVVLIEDFCLGFLRYSQDERDQTAWEAIRAALPSLGYVLTRRGIRSHVSPVDRVLSLSASKAIAASAVLGLEAAELGEDLRALILCDYERTGSELVAQLRGVLDPQAGSAVLLLETILEDDDSAALDPILLTGRTVACSPLTADRFRNWLAEHHPATATSLDFNPLVSANNVAGAQIVSISGPASRWQPRQYVPLITRFFEAGHSRCLIGTRGLLGEGWDAKRVNVLVDLTTASTATSVHQMRGRSLRLDPALPNKVANNWDIVCIDPEHPKGTADYERFVRKHRYYYAPNREGEIESGVSHVHHSLSPFGPPSPERYSEINASMMTRAAERDRAYERWGIGEPYDNIELHTVRVRSARSMGVPNRQILRGSAASETRSSIRTRGAIVAVGTGIVTAGIVASGLDPVAFLLPAGGGGIGALWAARPFKSALNALGPSDNLEDFAMAVMEGLRDTGDLPSDVSSDRLRIVAQDDGYYRCYLAGLSNEQSELFATALDELLAPLSAPRYIIPRFIAKPPRSTLDALLIGMRVRLRRRSGSSVVYHAIPEALARNRDRVAALERAWNRHVSAGQAIFYRNEKARAILAVQGGEDPFEITTQMRVLWQ